MKSQSQFGHFVICCNGPAKKLEDGVITLHPPPVMEINATAASARAAAEYCHFEHTKQPRIETCQYAPQFKLGTLMNKYSYIW